MKVTWDKIEQGDFFFLEMGELGTLLYQKVKETNGYNAVLLNTGELCQIFTPNNVDKLYNKVSVSFSILDD